MEQWVGLLRGVNVGGHKKVPMAELRSACTAHGFHDVQTYIASGNLVFAAEGDSSGLSQALGDIIKKTFDLDVQTMVFAQDAMRSVLESCPIPEAAGNLVHAVFFDDTPTMDQAIYWASRRPSESLVVGTHAAWLSAPEGVSRSKLMAQLDKVLPGTALTVRNLNTVRRLVEMLDASRQDC